MDDFTKKDKYSSLNSAIKEIVSQNNDLYQKSLREKYGFKQEESQPEPKQIEEEVEQLDEARFGVQNDSSYLTEQRGKVDYRQATMVLVVDNVLDAENMLLAALEFMSNSDVEKFLKKSGVMSDIEYYLEQEDDDDKKTMKPRTKRKVSTRTRVKR